MTPYLSRELSTAVGRALEALPVVVVTGLRQAGKTTFLRHDSALGGRRYFSLDDFATLDAAQRDPDGFVAGDEPLTIDEAQKCPDLLVAVKRAVDRRREPGHYVLSGSANLALLDQVNESLAGRALYVTLQPMTRRERQGRTADRPFLVGFLEDGRPPAVVGPYPPVDDDEIAAGGLPPVALGEAPHRDLWFLGYEQTYVERDLRDVARVDDVIAFRNLVRLAALRTGQLLNQSELARDARLPSATATRYLGLLETTFLTARLAPYLRSPVTRLVKTPKLFFTDSGLAAHLAGISLMAPGVAGPLRGQILETFVAQNLAGILGAWLPRAELAFWNVQGRAEVDFVVTHGERSLAIEVKSAARFGPRDVAGLTAFVDRHPEALGGVLAYAGDELLPLGDRLWAVPLGMLLA